MKLYDRKTYSNNINHILGKLEISSSKIIENNENLEIAIDKIYKQVSRNIESECATLLKTFYYDLQESLFEKSSFFKNSVENRNLFKRCQFRKDILGNFKFKINGIKYVEEKDYKKIVIPGTVVVAGTVLAVASNGLALPLSISIAGLLAYNLKKTSDKENKEKLKSTIKEFFKKIEKDFNNWFEEIEKYFLKRVKEEFPEFKEEVEKIK